MEGEGATLRDWLALRIRASGAIPFPEFMAAALTHPEFGYYCRPGITTGPRGDFYTSPDVHPAFGRMLSRQVAEIADRCVGATGFFELVEMGPGSGRLARDLAAGLCAERPDLAARTRLTLVEVSGSLVEAQRGMLSGGPAEGLAGVSWESWPALQERSRRTPFSGCVVANEFLDVLPVHLVECRDGALREVHVTLDGDTLGEVLLPIASPRLALHLEALETRYGVGLREGQRAEIGLAGLDWVAELAGLFAGGGTGGALLIDYGYPARDLYAGHRGRGTLLCYRRHRVVEDPFEHPGEQDMTAHVDFSSVADRARDGGLDVAPLTNQMKFLLALGLADELAGRGLRESAGAEDVRDRLAMHALFAPGGMGEVFKVLLMTRGTSAAELTGAADPFAAAAAMAPPRAGWREAGA